jgi:hypothetical protein
VWDLDSVLALIFDLKNCYLKGDQQLKDSAIQVLKRITCMQSQHVGDCILQIDEINEAVIDASFFTKAKGDLMAHNMLKREEQELSY